MRASSAAPRAPRRVLRFASPRRQEPRFFPRPQSSAPPAAASRDMSTPCKSAASSQLRGRSCVSVVGEWVSEGDRDGEDVMRSDIWRRGAGSIWCRTRSSLIVLSVAVFLAASAAAATASPIEHVVVILQENHSFDNVLGQLCIQDHRECSAASSGKNEKGETIPLTKASDAV